MHYKCLIIDDEIELAESTCEYFNMFEVKTAYVTGYQEGLAWLEENTVDLILLDINLGDMSGFELCKTIRQKLNIPILFISARKSDDDVLIALNIGGDDYIKKPYTLSVLLAKVKVGLKRFGSVANDISDEKYENQNLVLDYRRGKVMVDGKEVMLKAMEYKLLVYLIQNKGRIISKEELFEKVWEDAFTGDGTLNVHIRHLREKIENDAYEPMRIKTIWGRGYTYEDLK